jgi:hypothetical protein
MTIAPMTAQDMNAVGTPLYPMMSADPAEQRLEALRDEVCDVMFTSLGTSALHLLVRFVAHDFARYQGHRDEESILRQVAHDTDARGRNPWVDRMNSTISGLYLDALDSTVFDDGEEPIVIFLEKVYRSFGLNGLEVIENAASGGCKLEEILDPNQMYDEWKSLMSTGDRKDLYQWLEVTAMDTTMMKGIF